MNLLDGKIALVTGAARDRGIGRGIAIALAKEGCDVVINDLAATAGEAQDTLSIIRKLGHRAEFIAADVSQYDQVENMIADIESGFGPLDIVCSNAGVADWQPITEITLEVWDHIVGVNLTGAFNVCQTAALRMVPRKAGRIVITSSVHVQMPFPDMAVYGSTKQAVRALVDSMTVELSPHGILVNHIGPGWVKSFLNDRSPSLQTADDEQATMKLIPVARPGLPEEMGNAVVYLVSEKASYVTGAFLRIDGGLCVGKF